MTEDTTKAADAAEEKETKEEPIKEEATPEVKEETPTETKEEAKAEETPETKEAPTEEVSKEEVVAEETPAEETTDVEATPEEAPAKEEAAPTAKEDKIKVGSEYKTKVEGAEDVRPGMTVNVWERIKDLSPKGEERERIQKFQGIVIGMKGSGLTRTITVRRVQKGFGVEKIYPLNSPNVSKIEIIKIANVRRAKLNYLRNAKKRFKRKLKETWIKKTK